MRIIAGSFKGKAFAMPAGIRPTQDIMRKSVFDTLGVISGVGFLELFAGSGAMGLEAASRGAERVVMVEQARACVQVLERNVAAIGCAGVSIIEKDAQAAVEQLGRRKERFDIVFLDPPYYQDLAKKTLQTISSCAIVAPGGLAIVQHFKKDALPDTLGDLTLFRQVRYGDTVISWYRKTYVPEGDLPGNV